MSLWFEKHWPSVLTLGFGVFMLYFGYGCESKVQSLQDPPRKITRTQFDEELLRLMQLAEIRKIDLDRQDELRSLILNNALILIEGNQINPFGIITAIAGLYGIAQGGKNIKTAVKNGIAKSKESKSSS